MTQKNSKKATKKAGKTTKSDAAKREEKTLAYWQKHDIFNKTLAKDSPKGEFVFYEGPPTANGRPGIHHIEARSFKDIIPRYKTMQGYHVRRKAGWDTHGLPVEIQVEKQLGLNSKREIEEYGIAEFNNKCKESVLEFVDEWRAFTDRIAFWADQDNAYWTFNPDYMESLWHILQHADNQKLLYKDYRVAPWCPRCGTALSSHELAQGYETVKDLSVYVEFELVDFENTYVLAWTTTPWTLPGNVALAVGLKIDYVKIQFDDKKFILAKDLLEQVVGDQEYEVIEEFKGADLTGHSYKPLYPFIQDNLPEDQRDKLENAWRIYADEFVTTDDGTGIVHTAVMYGQDDFVLGKNVGLPMYHLVDEWGHFTDDVIPFKGMFVKEEATDVAIIKDLAHRGVLFKKMKYEHNYPHCWRCKTPLIYYARDSWYIRMSDLRSELIAANKKINWEPDYIKHGRFGEWIADVKDWAISRERYWGTPLPVWQNADGTDRIVIGSVEELQKYTKKSGNTYYITRHGESQSNKNRTLNEKNDPKNTLTEQGIEQARAAFDDLKKAGIELIYTSPLTRTHSTAKLIAEELGLSEDKIIVDERLREQKFGEFEGGSIDEYHAAFRNAKMIMTEAPKGGDNWHTTKTRITEFLYDIESKHQDTNILIVGHNGPMQMLQCGALGLNDQQSGIAVEEDRFDLGNAEVRKLEFVPLPHNEEFELDLHRPYIDDVVLISKKEEEMRRTPEVMDVWFDSGGMPFAQHHYPFENKDLVDKQGGYPADYICEAIDQTRGWFYTLHAESVILDRGPSFKNVICLGLLMDAEGKKMSKSLGNIVDPWEMADKYGVDVLRLWMYAVNQPGEPKNFDEKTVVELQRKVFNLFENVTKFYEMYADAYDAEVDPRKSPNVLDQWILAKNDQLTQYATKYLDNYKVLEPARAIRDHIADLSQWYIRRSRDRFKGEGEDQKYALAVTRESILTVAKLLAPFTPFAAEDWYKRAGGELESVHLDHWPQADKVDRKLLSKMEATRQAVSLGLEARASAGIKVRQPLAKLTLKDTTLKGEDELLALILDEVNVKEIAFDSKLETDVALDTELSKALIEEGDVRELIRFIQNMRKNEGLAPADMVELTVKTDDAGQTLMVNNQEEIKRVAGISEIMFKSIRGGEKVSTSGAEFEIKIV